MALIVLSTINARYVHAALGVRYLAANMGELGPETRIMEFVLGARAADMVETILADKPRIVGLGVYIWNAEETTRVVAARVCGQAARYIALCKRAPQAAPGTTYNGPKNRP